MADTQSDQIKVRCPCGVKIRVPASAAGKKAKCPQCAAVFLIPGTRDVGGAAPVVSASAPKARSAAPKSKASDSFFDDDDSMLDDLAAMSASAAAVETPDRPGTIARCSKCGTVMQAGAVMCIACGYNTETGKVAKVASTKPPKTAAVAKVALGFGGFLFGTILACIGAAIGMGIWILVAWFTERDFRIIAWAVGALAGLGMLLGYRKPSAQGGFAAAGIALAMIIGAKYAVYTFIVFSVGLIETREIDRELLTVHYTTLEMRQQGLAHNDPEAWDIYQTNDERFSEMSVEGVDRAIAEVRTWYENRWGDDDYVRRYLIYAEIDKLSDGVALDEPEDDGGPSVAQWNQWYEAAVTKVDAIPGKQRAEIAQRTSTEKTSSDKEIVESLIQPVDEAALAEVKGLTFASMFHPFDGLWMLLAVSSAFKLGSGGIESSA